MFRHEENLCLFVTYFVLRVYTMLSCMLTCTLNSLSFMRTPHGSRLAAIRRVEKECRRSHLSQVFRLGSRAPEKGIATSPPLSLSPSPPLPLSLSPSLPLSPSPFSVWVRGCTCGDPRYLNHLAHQF